MTRFSLAKRRLIYTFKSVVWRIFSLIVLYGFHDVWKMITRFVKFLFTYRIYTDQRKRIVYNLRGALVVLFWQSGIDTDAAVFFLLFYTMENSWSRLFIQSFTVLICILHSCMLLNIYLYSMGDNDLLTYMAKKLELSRTGFSLMVYSFRNRFLSYSLTKHLLKFQWDKFGILLYRLSNFRLFKQIFIQCRCSHFALFEIRKLDRSYQDKLMAYQNFIPRDVVDIVMNYEIPCRQTLLRGDYAKDQRIGNMVNVPLTEDVYAVDRMVSEYAGIHDLFLKEM